MLTIEIKAFVSFVNTHETSQHEVGGVQLPQRFTPTSISHLLQTSTTHIMSVDLTPEAIEYMLALQSSQLTDKDAELVALRTKVGNAEVRIRTQSKVLVKH